MSANENSSRWLWPVLAASVCWSISDVICDICIDEEEDSDDEDEEILNSNSFLGLAKTNKQTKSFSIEGETNSKTTLYIPSMANSFSYKQVNFCFVILFMFRFRVKRMKRVSC